MSILGKRKPVRGIHRDLLEIVADAAKESHPREFLATLVVEDGIISELNLIPGTIQGDRHAIMPQYMRPVDINFSTVGTVHTHPGPSNRPSDADRLFFSKYGRIHVIMCMPYDMHSWRAYSGYGEAIELPVVED